MKSKFNRILGVGLSVVMLTSMLVTAAPALALSTPTLTVTGTTISGGGQYVLSFTAGTNITSTNSTTGSGYIQVVFPAGTKFGNLVSSADNASSVQLYASSGFAGGNDILTGTTFNATADGAAAPTLNITIPAGGIGIGSLIVLNVGNATNNVTNVNVAGNYTLTVATYKYTSTTAVEAAVTTNTFEIKVPSIDALPGVVSVYNPAGVLMGQSTSIATGLATITSAGWLITLTGGTYTESPSTAGVSNSTTIQAASGVAASAVIIKGTVTLNSVAATLDSVTVSGTIVIGTSANNTVIKNSSVARSSSTTSAKTLIAYGSTGVNAVASVTNVTIDTSSGSIDDTAGANVNVGAGQGITFTGCTFKGDAGDDLLLIAGGNVTVPIAVNSCTFVAESASAQPYGITVSSGFAAITNSTFTNLDRAIQTSGSSNTTVQTSTITGGGNPTQDLVSGGAIVAGGTSTLILTNNTISNSNAANYALNVAGANVTARFNTITGNTLNVQQQTGTANVSLNWWGSAAGPAASSLKASTAANLVTTPVLAAAVTNPALGFATDSFIARTTAGVDVLSGNNSGALGTVGAAKYAANPQSAAPTGTPIAYFDVFVSDVAAGTTVTIKFYGNVNDNTKVYYGGGLNGAWSLASNQGVNTANGFAYITVTTVSSPSISELAGTPFVLTTIVPPPTAPVLLGPDAGRDNIPTNTGFSWSAVAGATYMFQVSTSPAFTTTIADVNNLTSNVYGGVALAANTTYYWRVMSMVGTVKSAWTTSTFTTAAPAGASTTAPPVINITAPPAPNVTVQAPPAAQVTVQAPPPANVTVNPPAVTVQAPPPAAVTVNVPESAPLIPTYILWMIILIGAVLIIALIVLIVRTRRVA